MGKAAKLKSLPSVVQKEDGSVRPFGKMPLQEQIEYQNQMAESIEKCIGDDYAQHTEEWEKIISYCNSEVQMEN